MYMYLVYIKKEDSYKNYLFKNRFVLIKKKKLIFKFIFFKEVADFSKAAYF